jgi:GTPase SAR1 family protein
MILHLSDIHLGKTDWITSSSEKICKATENVASDCEHIVVTITGDLTANGIQGEYDKVLLLIENIRRGFKTPPINKEIVVITVPGNHDCNFNKITPERTAAIAKAKSMPFGDIDLNIVNQCASIQNDYFEFASKIGNKWEKQTLGYVVPIRFADFQITFSCYNTAWMSTYDLLIGNNIFPVNCANSYIKVEASNLRISLFHHPLDWFFPDNKRVFKEYLTRTSDLVLTGHEHEMGRRLEDNLDGKVTLYIEAGELQDQKILNKSGFISLLIETSTSTYRIMEYKWNGNVFLLSKETNWTPNYGKKLGRESMNHYSIDSLFQESLDSLDAPIFYPGRPGVLQLDEVFVYPHLRNITEEKNNVEGQRKYFSSAQFLTQPDKPQKVFILGDAKSGKTALCKKLYKQYHSNDYVPIYIKADEIEHSSLESFDKLLSQLLSKQYKLEETDKLGNIASEKLVLLIDDFEKTNLPTEELAGLLDKINSKFTKIFIFADSIFEIEDVIAKNSRLYFSLSSYEMFSIPQFGYELRLKLIRKWNRIGIKPNMDNNEELIRKDDEYEQRLNSLLADGTIISSFPIFLLTLLLAIDTGNTQNLETSSYSHYYQFIISRALIELHLSNPDVENYNSFLTNLAQKLFLSRSRVISKQDLADFHVEFVRFYRVSPNSVSVYQFDRLCRNLCNADILEEYKGSFSFKQGFVYYFFVGKYLAEKRTSSREKENILSLIKGLQYDEYANIVMFVIHHTKEDYILRAIIDHAKGIFANFKPMKLENDASYVSDLLVEIPKAVLKKMGAQEYRIEKSKQKDQLNPPKEKTIALREKEIPPSSVDESNAIEFITNLVIASRLISLLGQILIDYRSIPGDTQEEIAEETYLLSLRSMSGIFDLFENQNEKITDNIVKRLVADGVSDESKIKSHAKIILYNVYQVLTYSLIKTVSDSIGSDTLSAVVVNIPRKYPYLSIALIDISAKLDHYHGFPQGELVDFMKMISVPRSPNRSSFIESRVNPGPQILKSRLLPFTLLRQFVEEYLYKFPPDYKERQKIASIIGIKIPEQLMIGQISEETKQNQ